MISSNIKKTTFDQIKPFVVGAVFTFAFIALVLDLTGLPLWYDETVEYYYSKYLVGTVPDGKDYINMYQRICQTYQPPLYNVLMYFWLRIKDTEWWFKFLGVIFGTYGLIGVYKLLKNNINDIYGLIVVLMLACTKKYVWYSQEASEYCLVLAIIPWMIYKWIEYVKRKENKTYLSFIIYAVLASYSQYGTLFLVFSLLLVGLWVTIINRDHKKIIFVILTDIITFISAFIPLWFLFLSKQLADQQKESVNHSFGIKNFYNDLFGAYQTTIEWNINAVRIPVMILLLLFFASFFFSIYNIIIYKDKEREWILWLDISIIICWFVYYFAVRSEYYAYGDYGLRYSLFFLPVFFICFAISINEVILIIDKIGKSLNYQNTKLVLQGVLVGFSMYFLIVGWGSLSVIYPKEDIRSTVQFWYDNNLFENQTLVYYGANTGFSYYLTHNKKYQESYQDNIKLMKWYRNGEKEEYWSFINDIYNDSLPDQLYFVVCHYADDLNTIIEGFEENGYVTNTEFENKYSRILSFVKE